MSRSLWSFGLWLCICVWALAAEESSLTLYVQLVRGTSSEKPQEPSWKAIGPKLSKRLSPVFRWNKYWEVGLHEVTVEKGKRSKVSLDDVRKLEIERMQENDIELRLYRKGELTRKCRQKLNAMDFAIMGGAGDDDSSWFVVVRRDPPRSASRE